MKSKALAIVFFFALTVYLGIYLLPVYDFNAYTQNGMKATAQFSQQTLKLCIRDTDIINVTLDIRGSLQNCVNISFAYEPEDPTIEPWEDLCACPNVNPSLTECKRKLSLLPSERGPPDSLLPRLRGSPRSFLARDRSISLENIRGATTPEAPLLYNVTLPIKVRRVGQTLVTVATETKEMDVTGAFLRVSVILDPALDQISIILGWISTIAWDVSFFPQVILNFRRKSVVGLSFDFVAFNVVGYLSYTVFNLGLYAVPYIQNQFSERYPTAVNHVRLNDVGFACYGLAVQTIIAIQCLVYHRSEDQRLSLSCRCLVGAATIVSGLGVVLAAANVIWWLDVFYLMSYIKLFVTLLKYIPQLWVNYKRKGTGGVSKLGMQLDFLGGVMSLIQMFLLAANNDDWISLFTNVTKFGLGAITVIYDMIFFVQHYVVYRQKGNTEKNEKL